MLSSDVAIESLTAGDLTITAEDEGGAGPIRLRWTGSSTDRYPGRVLGPYFAAVLAEAAGRQAPVEMRFEKLEHFNSSTITCIIQVIQQARKQSVKLVIVFDQALKWQRLSFDALRVFSKGDALFELRPV
jgi:hypothetical protein